MGIIAVRRESVRIDVDSNLAQVAARDAAAVKLLATNLDSLSRSGVQSDRATQKISSSLDKAGASARKSSSDFDRADSSINQLTGRLRLFADVAAILGPALAPVGALAVPAVAGLANQLGFAAAAGGTALLAFQGVGDAIGAMNEYALEPSVANFNEVEAQLSRLSPQAATFAREIGSMRETFVATRDAAAEGLFPGLTRGLDDLDGLLGRVQPILREVGDATGDMLADGLASLNSDRWQPFFDFLEREARPTLMDLGSITGDFAHGLSELWMATQPLNNDFSGWLVDVADGFDGWAAGLSQTDGFNEFMAYIRDTGPQVADTMSVLGGALLDIAVAAAPLGGPALAGLEMLANVVSAIAESPAGSALFAIAGGLALVNRAMKVSAAVSSAPVFGALTGNLDKVKASATGASGGMAAFAASARSSIGNVGRIAGPLAGLALASATADENIMGANTASLALMGSMAGPWGAAIGGGVGLVMDLAQANDGLVASTERLNAAIKSGDLETMNEQYRKTIDDFAAVEMGGGFWEETLGGGMAVRAMSKITGATGDGAKKILEAQEAINAAAVMPAIDTGLAAAGMIGISDAALEASDSAAALEGALLSLNDALDGRASMRDYEEAIDAVNAALEQNGKGMDINTEKGRANQAALDNIAATSIAVADTLTGVERRRFLVRARQDFIAAAQTLGLNKREARALANDLGLLGKVEAKPKVSVDTSRGDAAIGTTRGNLAALNRFRANPSVNVNAAQAGAALGGVLGFMGRVDRSNATPTVTANTAGAAAALGGVIGLIGNINSKSVTITTYLRTVRTGVTAGAAIGAGRAYGGPVLGPGTDRSDNLLTPTSPGEWIHQAPAVRYYGPKFMDDINNMRISKQAMERQGVASAMRSSSGRQNVNVNVSSRGYLDLSDGRRITLDTIDERIDQRIDDVLFNRDEFDRSESARVAG